MTKGGDVIGNLQCSNQAAAQKVAAALLAADWKIVTVESCTGGLLAGLFSEFSGSSAWFDRGFVTYSNQAKHEQVGVAMGVLARHGAVSLEVAKLMAEGGLEHSQAQLAVAITGIAGPSGGSLSKPVGTVMIAVAALDTPTQAEQYLFAGDRSLVRAQSIAMALTQILNTLQQG